MAGFEVKECGEKIAGNNITTCYCYENDRVMRVLNVCGYNKQSPKHVLICRLGQVGLIIKKACLRVSRHNQFWENKC